MSIGHVFRKIGRVGQVRLVVDVIASIYFSIILLFSVEPIRNGFTGFSGFVKYVFFLVGAVIVTALLFVPGYRRVIFLLNWLKLYWLRLIVRRTPRRLRSIAKYPLNILSNIVTQFFYAFLVMQLSPMSDSRTALLIVLLVSSMIALNGIVKSAKVASKKIKSSHMRLVSISVSTIILLAGWMGTVEKVTKIDNTFDIINEAYLKYDYCAFSKNQLLEECDSSLPIEERIFIYNSKRKTSPRF